MRETLYHSLTSVEIMLAVALILINAAVSMFLRLKMEGQLLLASVRTVVQLYLVGLMLQWVFSLGAWYLVLIVTSTMTAIAGYSAVNRARRRFPGIWAIGMISVWTGSWSIGIFALVCVVQADPWYQPQYAIPLLGMILGNALTGTTLGLDRLCEGLIADRARVETLLAMGASRWEAAERTVQEAVRMGMVPTINSMMVVGIVSLPGMMTGQLLTGTDPLEAVKYQIVIMFLIASSTATVTVLGVLLGFNRLINGDHQFFDKLQQDGDSQRK